MQRLPGDNGATVGTGWQEHGAAAKGVLLEWCKVAVATGPAAANSGTPWASPRPSPCTPRPRRRCRSRLSQVWVVYPHVSGLSDMATAAQQLLSDVRFWLAAVVLAPAMALLLDLAIDFFQRTFYPKPFQIMQVGGARARNGGRPGPTGSKFVWLILHYCNIENV